MNPKPHHTEDQEGLIAFGNIYPRTSPKWESPQATFKHHQYAPPLELEIQSPEILKLHYSQKVAHLIGTT